MTSKCPICGKKRDIIFNAIILSKYSVSYLLCDECGLLQTEEPYWLDEAYNNAISDTDTGLVARNISISKKLACIIFFLFPKEEKYLDIAGGYGMLTRLMRDIGFDFYWSDKYCENILAKGFEIPYSNKYFTGITAFEVLEHVYNPIEFIKKSLNDAKTSTIIFSTELYQEDLKELNKWWYLALESGQHVSLYQLKTLKFIANKLSLNFYSFKNIHIITDKRILKIIWIILVGRISDIVYALVKMIMESKTITDYEEIKRKA
jgi:Methyltransferase domain